MSAAATKPRTTDVESPVRTVIDRNAVADEAIAINVLIDWVISARDTLGIIRSLAAQVPALKDALADFEIPFNSPGWSSEEGDATALVLLRQRELIEMLARGEASAPSAKASNIAA